MSKNVQDYIVKTAPEFGTNHCKNCGSEFVITKNDISKILFTLRDENHYDVDSGYLILCEKCKFEAGIFVVRNDLSTVYGIQVPYGLQYFVLGDGNTLYCMLDVRLYLKNKHRLKTEAGLDKLIMRMQEKEKKQKEKQSVLEQKKKLLDAFIAESDKLKKTLTPTCYQLYSADKTIDDVKEYIEEFRWMYQNGPFFRIYELLVDESKNSAERNLFISEMFVIKEFIDKNGDKSIADIPHSLYRKYKETIDEYVTQCMVQMCDEINID